MHQSTALLMDVGAESAGDSGRTASDWRSATTMRRSDRLPQAFAENLQVPSVSTTYAEHEDARFAYTQPLLCRSEVSADRRARASVRYRCTLSAL